MTPVSYRESHKEKGSDYHATFRDIPRRAMMWDLEKRVLRDILSRFFERAPASYLDFACGTGRILSFLESRAGQATGVDVSASMLDDARTRVRSAELIEADLTERDVLGDRRFDLVTSFRFFPNAEPALREDVMAVLARHLAPGGILVFNNHMNQYSLARRLVRLGGRSLAPTMTDAQARGVVAVAGLTVERRYAIGVLPLTDKKMFRPVVIPKMLELVLGKLPGAASIADDVVYVCRKPVSG